MVIPTEHEFLELIIETLNLDSDVEITAETALFGGNLDLNSIDALEIGAVINQRFKVELKVEDEATRQAYANVRSLYIFVTDKMRQKIEAKEANAA
ncbi:phosphopantetheine-binding protein [Dyella tabacisoli]|uniref:Acyl carrier protein n=1 Tax=Dyella tabacisoli TaxID=2282381 RepID=A0A369UL67_9GAMM|nr:phosphopantetheine-binding protein [Dyella tabacisoli]RDD81316.1 acyl carrier protein [Dyella tabacisoli]